MNDAQKIELLVGAVLVLAAAVIVGGGWAWALILQLRWRVAAALDLARWHRDHRGEPRNTPPLPYPVRYPSWPEFDAAARYVAPSDSRGYVDQAAADLARAAPCPRCDCRRCVCEPCDQCGCRCCVCWKGE